MKRLVSLLALALVGGCGSGDNALVPVTGTVKYADGSNIAFESGTVTFAPTAGGKSGSGPVESDGSFSLTTETPGDGVKPGAYKVVVQLWKNYRDQAPAIDPKYGDAATTTLEATVDSGHAHFDFTIEK